MTTRERKMKFIEAFGRKSLEIGVTECLIEYGPDWLTDEQIADIVKDKVHGWRRSTRNTIRNRAIQAAKVAP